MMFAQKNSNFMILAELLPGFYSHMSGISLAGLPFVGHAIVGQGLLEFSLHGRQHGLNRSWRPGTASRWTGGLHATASLPHGPGIFVDDLFGLLDVP